MILVNGLVLIFVYCYLLIKGGSSAPAFAVHDRARSRRLRGHSGAFRRARGAPDSRKRLRACFLKCKVRKLSAHSQQISEKKIINPRYFSPFSPLPPAFRLPAAASAAVARPPSPALPVVARLPRRRLHGVGDRARSLRLRVCAPRRRRPPKQRKGTQPMGCMPLCGASRWTRTNDPLINSQML